MIRTDRSVRLICVVTLGGLILTGCIGAESNLAMATPALTASENTAKISVAGRDDGNDSKARLPVLVMDSPLPNVEAENNCSLLRLTRGLLFWHRLDTLNL